MKRTLKLEAQRICYSFYLLPSFPPLYFCAKNPPDLHRQEQQIFARLEETIGAIRNNGLKLRYRC